MKGRVIALDQIGGQAAAALIVDGQLHDFLIDPAGDVPQPGAICRAVADRPMKGQGGVFVRLPQGDTGFLRQVSGVAPGQRLLVQVSGVAEPGSPVARGLESIVQTEPAFDPREFIEGAKAAYEAIVVAFAKGDRKTLRALLSRDVGEGFERAIDERERNKQTVETTFVSIDKAEIVAAETRNRVAHITVRFLSNLITATRDAQGNVVDGNAEAVVEVPDVWTFSRQLGSRDPNWQLVATEAGA